MNDDTRFDDTLREFLRHRASDTAAVRDISAMSAAIAVRLPGQGRRREGAFAGRLVLVATLTVLLLLAVATVLVGSQRPPVLPSSLGNGVIAYATQSGLSPVYLVRPGEAPRQIIPSETGVGNTVVCPTFSPDGTMLAVGMPGGSIGVLSIDEHGEVGDVGRLGSRAGETPHCPAWAPDGSAVAFLDGSTLEIDPLVGQPRRIEDWETAGGADATAFAVDYPSDRAVQWSPDGATIAVARPSGTWLLAIDGTAPRQLHESPANTVSWSPDSSRLVVRTLRGTLVINASDGAEEATLPPGSQPVWSPRGDRIAYVDDGARIVVIGPDGSDPRVIASYGYDITWSPDGNHVLYIHDGCAGSVCPYAHGYALMSQAIGADGNPEGDAVVVVPMVEIGGERSYPPAQQFSWQLLPAAVPSESRSASPTARAERVTSPPASVAPATAERFVMPFEYTVPQGSELAATTESSQMYALTEGSSSTYPGFGYEPVSDVRGITIAFAAGASTHRVGGRADLRLGPDTLLEDLQENPTLAVGPISGTSFGGLAAVRSHVAAVAASGSAGYPDLHLDPLAGGDAPILALGFPGTLTVAQVDGGFLIVHVWAADADELEAWLPLAERVVSSIRFLRAP
jgi:WD40-like Beta Propeller Repeat